VLNTIVCRESASKAELDRQSGWGHYVGEKDEWGVTEEEEKEVSVKVHSNIEDSKRSSACRCCVSLHSFWANLLRTATPSVLPEEAARALVPVSELSFSSRATGMLPIALSEVLGIGLSEVMAKYFDGACSVNEAAVRIAEDIDRRVTAGEGEIWLANEQRKIEERMERDHQGAGVDDNF
jgi:hypothetical protein